MGGGGGGGSTDVLMRQPSEEKKSVGNWYDFQTNQFSDFTKNQPLLNSASQGALGFWDQLPSMLGKFGGYQDQLTKNQSQLGGLYGQFGGLGTQLGGQASQLGSWLGQVTPTITSGGALTPQMERDVSQSTRNIFAAQGNTKSTGALGTELLNRDAYKQQRFNTALQQGQGLLGQQSGVYGQQAGVLGAQQGVLGQQAGVTGQQAGLLGQQQALQTGGLNQLLGVQNAETGNFSQLTNPILGYLGNLFSGNQQASVAQAQIAAQQQAAGDSKAGGLASGGASIIGAVLPALMAFSDKRLKQNIRSTGLKTSDDVPIKTFEYKAQPGQRVLGVIAQDVEKKHPEAVMTDFWSGLKLIDRTKIDIPMAKVE